MATRVASLEAVLELNKKAFDKSLKETDKSLGKAKDGLADFTKQTDKFGVALGEATNKGRRGLSEIDQQADNARGSLGSMLGVLGGGAAAAAESSLDSISANVLDIGKDAGRSETEVDALIRSLRSGFDKAGADVKDFGKDAGKALDGVKTDARKAADGIDDLGDEADNAADKFGGMADGIWDMIPGLDKLKGLAGGGGPLALLAGGALAVGSAIYTAGTEAQGTFNLIQARTGATGAELDKLNSTAQNVFIQGFGESAADAADAVIQVKQILGETGTAAEDSAKKALTMRDVFGIDIPESLRAVRSANKQFGDETAVTFDMMTSLIQRVGDPYQDLADTINEYSADVAQAGFTQAEFFGILETGVSMGARNFDILADLVREFTIRIIDGSDTTADAITDLFEATGRGSAEMAALEAGLDNVSAALEENEAALMASEGAYETQAAVVDDLEDALSSAQRKLDELSRPNLKGMQEFDDQLFSLDQQAKRLQLALLDLEEDTPAFEDTKNQLKAISDEMDRVSLERDLTIEPQLRAIEKAATEGLEPVVSYEQALADVAAQKDKIAGLEGAFTAQKAALEPLANEYERLTAENATLITQQDELKEKFENLVTPAGEFLAAIANGEMTSRDAMSAILQMLAEVENQVVADQIAVDLFGTKAEELGLDIVLALDPAKNKMTEFEGATNKAAEAMEQGLGAAIDRTWRLFKTSFGEGARTILSGDLGEIAADAKRGIQLGVKTLFGGSDEGEPPPSFAAGGVVPGPIGQAVPIIAHGGERFQGPNGEGSGSAGVTVIINGSINGEAHLQQTVMDAFGQLSQALAGGTR